MTQREVPTTAKSIKTIIAKTPTKVPAIIAVLSDSSTSTKVVRNYCVHSVYKAFLPDLRAAVHLLIGSGNQLALL